MADLLKRALGGGRQHADQELALNRVRTDAEAVANFTAVASDWADPPPTTLAEAIARLAAATPGA